MAGNNLFIDQPGAGSWGDELVPENPTIDPFGRRRISMQENLLDSKLITGKQGVLWSEELLGGATSDWDIYNSCVNMGVINNGDLALRQTRQRLNYQAGRGQLFEMTGILEPEVGTIKRLGACVSDTVAPHEVVDGVCFETRDGIMGVSIYKQTSTGTDVRHIPQSGWDDKLDGTGPSGVNIDWSKTQIFVIDYQWLGVGTVRFGLNVDGETYYVHIVHNSNRYEEVYMRTGNQPLHYEIRSTGGAGTLKQICCTVISEGGQADTGVYASLDLGNTIIPVTTTPGLVIAIRLQSQSFSSVISQIKAYVLSTSNDAARWMLLWNPIITGTPNWQDIPGGTIQSWEGTGAETVTPIIAPDAGYFSDQERSADTLINTNLRLGASITGEADVFALAIQNISGSANVTGGIVVRQQT